MAPLSTPRLLFRRWADNRLLMVGVFVSMVVAAALVAAAPVYLSAMERLSLNLAIDGLRRPFSNVHVYSRYIPLTQPDIEVTEESVSDAAQDHLSEFYDWHERYLMVNTYLAGYPKNPLPVPGENRLSSRAYFRSYSSLLDHVSFVHGGPGQGFELDDFHGRTERTGPPDTIVDAWGEWPVVEAIVSIATARMFGIEVGDLVTVAQDIGSPNRIYAVIAGVFTATDPTEDYWLFHASTFIDPHVDEEEVPEEITTPYDPAEPPMPLFISESSMVDGLGQAFPGVLIDSMWFIFIDKEGLKGLEIPEVRDGLAGFRDDVLKTLPGSEVTTEITETLDAFERTSFFSRVPLLLLLTMMVVTVVFYLSMMAGYLAQSRQRDLALLGSRGVGRAHLLRIHLAEGAVMAVGAVLLSPLVAMGATALAGKLPVFNESTGGALLPVKLSWMPFAAAAGAGVLCLAIVVLPAVLGGQGGLLMRKLQTARPPKVLLLHRYYLDTALLILGGLVFWELQSRGHFVSGGLFENIEVNEPLLLGPALFMIMVALAFMRILPLVVRYIGGESPTLVHALVAASLVTLGPGLIISEVRSGEPAGWVAGTLALAAFAGVYVGTAWATMMRFRVAGLVCQALLVCAFVLLERPDPNRLLFMPTVGLMAAVPAQAVFMAFQALRRVTPVWLLMGLRNMARNPMQYTWLVVLMVLATGAGIVSTTVGGTLERSKNERVLYDVAADYRVTGMGAWMEGDLRTIKERFMRIPGVTSVSPALRHIGAIGPEPAELLAVDSTEFPYISWYRDDFSEGPLGSVMRALQPTSVVERIALPEGSTSIGVWAKPIREYPNMAIYVVLSDDYGNQGTMRLGMVGPAEWHLVRGRLPRTMSYPVYLSAVQILEPYFGEGQELTAGAVLLDDIHVTVGPAGVEYTLEDFEGPMRWTPILTSALSSDRIASTRRDVLNGNRSGLYVFRGESSRGARGFYQSPTGGPVPVVMSDALAQAAGAGVGEVFSVELAGMRVPVEVRETVKHFPTMGRGEQFLLVDLKNLLDHLNVLTPGGGIRPNELFLAEAPAAGDVVRDAVRGMVLNPTAQVHERSAQLDRFDRDPLATAGWRALELLSLLIAVVAVGFGYVSYLLLFRDRSLGEMAFLRALGLSRRQMAGLLTFEHVTIAAIGLALGTWAGFQMSRLMVAPLAVTEQGRPVLPPFILTTDWGLMVPTYAVLLGIFVVSLLVLHRGISRLELSRVTRLGEN